MSSKAHNEITNVLKGKTISYLYKTQNLVFKLFWFRIFSQLFFKMNYNVEDILKGKTVSYLKKTQNLVFFKHWFPQILIYFDLDFFTIVF